MINASSSRTAEVLLQNCGCCVVYYCNLLCTLTPCCKTDWLTICHFSELPRWDIQYLGITWLQLTSSSYACLCVIALVWVGLVCDRKLGKSATIVSSWNAPHCLQVKDNSNAGQVATAFASQCNRTGSGRTSFLCQQLQLQVAASTNGSLGKRPAAICSLLNECSTEAKSDLSCAVTGPSSGVPSMPLTDLDTCTLDGARAQSSSTQVPGFSLPSTALGANQCTSISDCSGESRCSLAGSTSQLCTCANAVDTCSPLGTCLLTPCAACRKCMSKAQEFVAQQQAASTPSSGLAGAWSTFCSANAVALGLADSSICSQASSTISSSYNANAGRRAGMLCTQLKLCTADMGSSCLITSTLGTTTSARQIDLCTVEVRC